MYWEAAFENDDPKVIPIIARNLGACLATASPDECVAFATALHAVAATIPPGTIFEMTLSVAAWAAIGDSIDTEYKVRYHVYGDGYDIAGYPISGRYDRPAVDGDSRWPQFR